MGKRNRKKIDIKESRSSHGRRYILEIGIKCSKIKWLGLESRTKKIVSIERKTKG